MTNKISVCEGFEGLTARKSGPMWRLVSGGVFGGGGVYPVSDPKSRFWPKFFLGAPRRVSGFLGLASGCVRGVCTGEGCVPTF